MSRSLRQFFNFFLTSFKSQIRTPMAWVLGFIFPVIFIILFGFISINPETKISVGVIQNDLELTDLIVNNYSQIDDIYIIQESSQKQELLDFLKTGSLDVVLEVQNNNQIKVYTNSAKIQNIQIFYQTLDKINTQAILEQLDSEDFKVQKKVVLENGQAQETKFQELKELPRTAFKIDSQDISSQETRYLDFVLPGILGYSLLSSAVFGVAYSFLSLRETKVLKRLFAAPTVTSAFILGQSSSRFIFVFIQTLLQLLIANLAFGFSPAGGNLAWFNLIFIMFISLLVFLSFGYVVAGLSKTDDAVASLANLIVLPQFILAGTFFTIQTLPEWLQTLIKFLPLYNFNEAMRFVAIEGLDLWDIKVLTQLGFLILWGILGYFVATKVFKVSEN
jgi:ABC-2 type transport system permease protein